MQAYEGYFQEDGRFISNNMIVKLPIRRQVIVNVLDNEIIGKAKTESQRQKEALSDLYKGLSLINGESFDEEFDAIMEQGFTLRELDI